MKTNLIHDYNKELQAHSTEKPLDLDLRKVNTGNEKRGVHGDTSPEVGTILTTVTLISVTKYVTLAASC